MRLSRFAVAGLLGAGVVAVAGCGDDSLESAKAESRIKDGIEIQGQTKVKSVKCPRDVEQKKGRVFNCNVTFADGQRSSLAVTQTDGDGSLAWNLTVPGGAPAARAGTTGATSEQPANGDGAAAGATQPAASGPPDIKGYKRFRSSRWDYSIEYPNDWKKSGNEGNVIFASKGGYLIHVFLARTRLPTVRSVRREISGRDDAAGGAGKVEKVRLGRYEVILAEFDQRTKGGASVTHQRYVYAQGGRVASVDLTFPKGEKGLEAAYDRIARSFRWE